MSAKALILHMTTPSGKTFPGFLGYRPYDLDLRVWPTFWKLYSLVNNYRTVKARALIFQMTISRARPFRGYKVNNFDPVIMTLEFDLLFENFNLASNFWSVRALILIFRYQHFLPSDLDLEVWPTFWKLKLANNLKTMRARALVFHMSILSDKNSPW